MGLLDTQIKQAIAKGFNGKLLSGTLRKTTTTGRDQYGDPITTTTDYACQGFVDDYSAITRMAAGIPATDSRVTLIAGLCAAEPVIGDKVLFSGQWWQIRGPINRDPANATHECQSYRVQS